MEEIFRKIDGEIEAARPLVIRDTVKLVNIKSVESRPEPGAPFGRGAREVIGEFLKMSEEAGFYSTDYRLGVASSSLKAGAIDLGIWVHGDVVSEGEGWNYPPYSATEYRGCIIGRGATDNKGQLAAIFNLLKIFKKLGLPLKYNPAIYLGSNEETGMADLVGREGDPEAPGFLNKFSPPRLSLVPDSGFPVGYGGKGGMNITLRAKSPLVGMTVTAGSKDAPGRAEAVFDTPVSNKSLPECEIEDGGRVISSFTPPRHGASPDPNGNMITKLSAALLDAGLIPEESRYMFELFKECSSDIDGELFGIKTEHKIMRNLTVFSKEIKTVDGYPEFTLNIRYPLGITYAEIVSKISAAAEARGFEVSYSKSGVAPYLNDPDSPIVKLLARASNEVTGDDKKPYTLSGGTYAHRLPNAYVFGTNGNLPPDDFPKGRGGAHGIDEAVSVDRLLRAMKIYARALIYLNETEW